MRGPSLVCGSRNSGRLSRPAGARLLRPAPQSAGQSHAPTFQIEHLDDASCRQGGWRKVMRQANGRVCKALVRRHLAMK